MAGRSIGIVLDLDSSRIVKRCKVPSTPGKRNVYEWRVDDPLYGPAMVFLRGDSDVTQNSLFGLLANPGLPCAESALAFRKDQLASFVTAGQAGVGGIVAHHVSMQIW